jgi:hypothetical protein
MDSPHIPATLVPVHAPLEATARFVGDEVPQEREDEESFPLVVLNFESAPEAAALFGSLLEIEAVAKVSARVEIWVSLEVDEEPYLEAHAGHPVLRFLVSGSVEGGHLMRALAFLTCVQCEPAFFSHVTQSQQFGLGGSLSDDVDPNDSSLLPAMLLVDIDPVEAAFTELAAWRRAYGNWGI